MKATLEDYEKIMVKYNIKSIKQLDIILHKRLLDTKYYLEKINEKIKKGD